MKLEELYEIKDGYYQVPVEVLENEYKCFKEIKSKNKTLEKQLVINSKTAVRELKKEISKNAKLKLEIENLIKYLEKKINKLDNHNEFDRYARLEIKEILDKVKKGNYND